MLKFFKRRSPAHSLVQPIQISPEDRLIAALAGYTPEQWEGISVLAKVDAREEFYKGRGLAS